MLFHFLLDPCGSGSTTLVTRREETNLTLLKNLTHLGCGDLIIVEVVVIVDGELLQLAQLQTAAAALVVGRAAGRGGWSHPPLTPSPPLSPVRRALVHHVHLRQIKSFIISTWTTGCQDSNTRRSDSTLELHFSLCERKVTFEMFSWRCESREITN